MLTMLATPLLLAALTLGPEHTLSTPGKGPAAGVQEQPQIATSGTETLVTWRDDTIGRSGLYIAAINEAGAVIEGTQRRFSPDIPSDPARIVWTGSSYLLLWSPGAFIKAMTIDRERRVVVPEHDILRNARVTTNLSRIGNRFAFLDGRALVVIDGEGNVLRQGPEMAPTGMVVGTQLVTDGTSFFVFWNSWDDAGVGRIYVRRFTPNGVARDAAPVAVTPDLNVIREDWGVAFGGGLLAIAAAEHHGPDVRTLRPFLIDPATLTSTTLASVPMGLASGTTVGWAGDRFVALWFQFDDQNVARMRTVDIARSGTVGQPQFHGCAAHGYDATELWLGTSLLTAFTVAERASADKDVFASVVDWTAGAASPCSSVAISPTWQSSPALATNGAQSLVAWTEGSDGGPVRLVAARTTKGVIDRAPLVLSESSMPLAASAAFTGSVYVVVWMELQADAFLPIVRMRRLSPEGAALDSEAVDLDYGFDPSIVWNGNVALITWSNRYGLGGTRVTSQGLPLDPQPLQIVNGGFGPHLVASPDGDGFLVVFEEGNDSEQPVPSLLDVLGARISNDGSMIGTAIPIATGPLDQYSPAVASDGRDFLVAYIEETPAVRKVVTKKILREGALSASTASDPGTVVESDEVSSSIAMAPLADGYAVVWENEAPHESSLRAAVVDRDGRVKDAPETVSRSSIAGAKPALATSGGRGDLVYGVLQNDEIYGEAMRLETRRIGPETTRARAVRH